MLDPDGQEREHKYTFLFVGGMDNTFYAIDADGGVLTWKYECGAPMLERCIAKDKTVYVKTVDGALHAFNVNPVHKDKRGVATGPVRSGQMRWKIPLGERFLVKGRNHVYVLGPKHTIFAMEEMTGKIVGRYPIHNFNFLISNIIDDFMYFVHPSGYIFAMRESKEKF
jgi:outer membrane protein assembly factor BamB